MSGELGNVRGEGQPLLKSRSGGGGMCNLEHEVVLIASSSVSSAVSGRGATISKPVRVST